MKEYGIPLANIKAFSSDGANAMSGAHNSVMSRLKQDNPEIFLIKCMAHSANLIGSKACSELPEYLNKFMEDVCNYFKSPKRCHLFEKVQEVYEVKCHKLLRSAKTRWLSTEACVTRFIEQWKPLRGYFGLESQDNEDNQTARNIYSNLTDPITFCYMIFLKASLSDINRFNVLFQANYSQIHCLLIQSLDLLDEFMCLCVKPKQIIEFKNNPNSIIILLIHHPYMLEWRLKIIYLVQMLMKKKY